MEGYEVRAFRYLLKQEMQQKLPLYFRDALAEIPTIKKLRFSVNAEPYRVAYKDILYLESQQRIVVCILKILCKAEIDFTENLRIWRTS